MGHVLAGPDGKLLFTTFGTRTTLFQLADPVDDKVGFSLPSTSPIYYFTLTSANEKEMGGLTVRMVGQSRFIARFDQFGHGLKLEERDSTSMGAWRRMFFIPQANLFVTLPASNDRLILRRFDVEAALEQSGIEYLVVTSQPPSTAKIGAAYAYPVVVKAKHGPATVKLETGPAGMTVSSAGVMSWTVPANASVGDQDAILSVRDARGQGDSSTPCRSGSCGAVVPRRGAWRVGVRGGGGSVRGGWREVLPSWRRRGLWCERLFSMSVADVRGGDRRLVSEGCLRVWDSRRIALRLRIRWTGVRHSRVGWCRVGGWFPGSVHDVPSGLEGGACADVLRPSERPSARQEDAQFLAAEVRSRFVVQIALRIRSDPDTPRFASGSPDKDWKEWPSWTCLDESLRRDCERRTVEWFHSVTVPSLPSGVASSRSPLSSIVSVSLKVKSPASSTIGFVAVGLTSQSRAAGLSCPKSKLAT